MQKIKPSAPYIREVSGRDFRNVDYCTLCAAGKAARVTKKFVTVEERVAQALPERFYRHVVGQTKYQSVGKFKYFVALLDCYSG